MTNFWLIRHGEPVAEARGRCYGSLDVELSVAGYEQMRATAELLHREPIACVYASPRRRALESARVIADAVGCSVEAIEGFREIDFGDFEGLTYDEIARLNPEAYERWMKDPTKVRFPKGECFSEMRDRVCEAFDCLLRARGGQTVAIVSHGGTNRILIARALGMPDECVFRLAQDYSAVNLLSYAEGVPSLRLMNKRGYDTRV